MSNGKRILVVDDDPDIVASIEMMLEGAGYTVSTARGAAECMKAVEAAPPDLILLDVMMEKLSSGLHVGYQLRADPATQSIPIIMISAIGEATGMRVSEAKDTDYVAADDFIEKPVRRDDLIARIESLLRP